MTILTARLADKNRKRAGVTDAVLRVSSPALTDAAGRVLYQGGYEDVPFSSDGTVTLDLLPTDTPGTNPSAWSYTFQVRYRLDGQRRAMPRFAAQVTGDTIDLATLQPQGTTDPVFVPPVNFQAAYAETLTARDGAVAARAGAEAARDVALSQTFAGVDLGTTDLNALTTPGIGRQASSANATLARNYPLANFIGTIEVLRSSDPAFPTSGLTQRATPIWSTGSGVLFWIRRKQSSADAWSSWKPIVTQRTDKTAGLAIYTWDDASNREQLIYGDTGWRDVRDLLKNGWALASGGVLDIRRTTWEVELRGAGLVPASATGQTFMDMPSGFAGWNGAMDPMFPVFVGNVLQTTRSLVLGGTLNVVNRDPSDASYRFSAKWSVTSSWPTSLPGALRTGIPTG